MSNATPLYIQISEAISSLSIPVGGGLAAYFKWRKNAERDRRAREEAARIASERSAERVRKEQQELLAKLLAEKDATIGRLEAQIVADNDERESLRKLTEDLLRTEGRRNNEAQ